MLYIKSFFGKNNLIFEMTVARFFLFAAVFLLSSYFSTSGERVAILLFGSVQIVTMLADLGLNNGFNRDLAKKNSRDHNSYIDSLVNCISIYWFLGLPVFLVTFIYSWLLLGDWTEYYWMASFYAVLLYLAKSLDIQLKSEGKYKTLNKLEIASSLATFITLVIYIFYNESLLFFDYSVITIITAFVVILLKRLHVRRPIFLVRFFKSYQYFKKVFNLAGPLAFVSLSNQFLPNLTIPMMISSMESSLAAGLIFTFRIFSAADQLSWGDFYGQLPSWYKIRSIDDQAINEMKRRAKRVLLKLIFTCLFLLLLCQTSFIQNMLDIEVHLMISISLIFWLVFARAYAMHTQIGVVCSKLKINYCLIILPMVFFLGILGLFDLINVLLIAAFLGVAILIFEINKFEKKIN